MTQFSLLAKLLLLAGTCSVVQAGNLPVPTVLDAIQMNRIQYKAARDGSVAAVSPDRQKAAAVVWHGDLEKNVNVYTVTVFNLNRPGESTQVLSREFGGDPDDQTASPFTSLQFLEDNHTLAFLGRDGDSAQVFTVDTVTKTLKQLTHHPTPVRSFVVAADGRLRAFSAVVSLGDETQSRLDQDGVFTWDSSVFPWQIAHFSSFPVLMKGSARQIRQYFLTPDGTPRLLFDSRQSRPAVPLDLNDPKVGSAPTGTLEDENTLQGWSTLTADPTGRYALLFPYGLTDHSMHVERYAYFQQAYMNEYARRVAAPYGLVDVKTGQIQRLLDAPGSPFEHESGPPLWAQDGRSVIIFTLLPDDPAALPRWIEVSIDSRKMVPLGLPKEWRPVAWTEDGKGVVTSARGGRFGTVHRTDRGWGAMVERSSVRGFNSDWEPATNGRLLIGVEDASLTPPEITALDLDKGKVTSLSSLNPQLHQRRYGAVRPLHWHSEHLTDAMGFLIQPVDFQPGHRYPLVVLFDDGTLHREGEPFLLDAAWQLSGHAIQMLAARGFMVLYTREPSMRDVVETNSEGERIREYVESAIDHLDRAGLIDPRHVGLAGWSRAGYYTQYMLIHSSFPFAAAESIDGGGAEYNEGMRPFTDAELQRIRTPLLF